MKISLTDPTKLMALSGYLFFGGSLASLAFMATTLAKMNHMDALNPTLDYSFSFFLLSYSIPLFLLAAFIFSGIIGYLLLSIAFASTKKIIPEDDRVLLEEIIKSKDEEPIKRYISLSSLTGAVGIFTKIGLTGLPLATIALTLIFALLSFVEVKQGTNFLDFTKLTLGAFLGSYVQRNIGQNIKILGEEAKK